MKAAFTKEIDFFAERGISTSTRRSRSSSRPAAQAADVRRAGARGSASPRTRATSPSTQACKALDAFDDDMQDKGRAILETVEAREPRRAPHARPPVPLDPGLNHGDPRGVPGARLSDPLDALDPARITRVRWTGCFEEDLDDGRHRDAARGAATCGRRTTRPTGAEGVGGEVRRAPPERRRARPVVVQVRPRRADLRPHRLDHRAVGKTPYSALHDIDANKPGGSIKIRVKTYAHTLKLHEERLEDSARRRTSSSSRDRREAPRAARAEASSSSTRVKQPIRRSMRADRGARREGRRRIEPPPDASPSSPRRASCSSARSAKTARSSASSASKRRTTVSQATIEHVDGNERQTKSATMPKPEKLPIAGDARHRRRARRSSRVEERERLGLPVEHAKHWLDDDAARSSRASQRAHTTILVSRPHDGARPVHPGARCAASATRSIALDVPDNDALQFGKEFGNRGQCNPTYFTVGNLVKYLDLAARRAGHAGQGHRREPRVPHRRRLRPVPLRHVRHRVPQGAARRRLRRLPRAAVPADRAASSRPPATSVGLEMNPTFFWRVVRRRSSIGDVLNALGYRIRPYEVEPGATDRALESAKKIIYDAFDEQHVASCSRSASARTMLRQGRRSTAPCAKPQGRHHRRVLGDDHRGRRQLQLQRFLEAEGAECDIQLSPRGSST